MNRRLTALLLMALSVSILVRCGGGGGGEGSGSETDTPAYTALDVSPSSIDSGDRMAARIEISDINPLGIALKIRYPLGVTYIRNSATLRVEDETIEINPEDAVITSEFKYLVFYLAAEDLGRPKYGIISLTFGGDELVEDGEIEIDTDVDDPNVSNSVEFDSDNPQFDTQDSVRIEVDGEAPASTPTPTPTSETVS